MSDSTRRDRPIKGRSTKEWVVRIPSSLLDHRNHGLSDRALVVLLVLEAFARKKAHCFPSNAKLAVMTGRSERQVKEILRELESSGWIRREGPSGGGKRTRIGLTRRITVCEQPSPVDGDPTGGFPPVTTGGFPPQNKDELELETGATEDGPNSEARRRREAARKACLIHRARMIPDADPIDSALVFFDRPEGERWG